MKIISTICIFAFLGGCAQFPECSDYKKGSIDRQECVEDVLLQRQIRELEQQEQEELLSKYCRHYGMVMHCEGVGKQRMCSCISKEMVRQTLEKL